MSSVYSPNSALLYAKSFIKKMPIDSDTNIKYQLLDYAQSLLWWAAPWSWTLGSLTNVTITGGTQDYSVSPPSDLLYVHSASLSDGNQENLLKIVPMLPATEAQSGNPTRMAYLAGSNIIRVFPKPPATYSQTLVALYKKVPATITASNYNTLGVQVFPDVYFPVYQAAVNYYAYLYADDQRAGTATVDENGKTQYTGALGQFQAMVWEMRKAEKLPMAFPNDTVAHG